jgi:hypothetical protein
LLRNIVIPQGGVVPSTTCSKTAPKIIAKTVQSKVPPAKKMTAAQIKPSVGKGVTTLSQRVLNKGQKVCLPETNSSPLPKLDLFV